MDKNGPLGSYGVGNAKIINFFAVFKKLGKSGTTDNKPERC